MYIVQYSYSCKSTYLYTYVCSKFSLSFTSIYMFELCYPCQVVSTSSLLRPGVSYDATAFDPPNCLLSICGFCFFRCFYVLFLSRKKCCLNELLSVSVFFYVSMWVVESFSIVHQLRQVRPVRDGQSVRFEWPKTVVAMSVWKMTDCQNGIAAENCTILLGRTVTATTTHL